MKAIAPNGLSITGTKDIIPAEATLSENGFSLDENGKLAFEYAGTGSIIDWDGQKTLTGPTGERLFLDVDGNTWPESQIKLVEVKQHALGWVA